MLAVRLRQLLFILLTAVFMMPVLAVFASWGSIGEAGSLQILREMAQTVLPEYILNSLWLCLGVGVGVGTLGVTTGWLTAMHEFPGRRFFEWALVLPLAMPAYVMAYVYTDFLQFVGPLQTALRETFGWRHGDYWFPDIRTLSGAILMFVCVLYPYVYLLVRTAFLERASGMLEAARTLGMGTLAEGIETPEQAQMMRTIGCGKGQGYLFSRPLARDALVQWMLERLPGD